MVNLFVFILIIGVLGTVSAFRHPGESQFIANERTSLDDCRQRFFQYFFTADPFGISGLPARLYEFAHMGAIGWSQPNGAVDWRCGGSLIWDNFVLTAAHCAIDFRNVPPDVVRFGDLKIFTEEGDEHAQQIGIAEFVRHPGHRFSSHYHDIALIRLDRNVTINETVLPACLWSDMEVRFKRMDAIGWGKVGFTGKQSPVLLKMGLSPISNEECGKVFNKETNRRLRSGLQEHHICASDEKADTCEGDSGGPLQVKLMHNMRETPFIVGVTSFGLPCSPENPGVYTRVAPYLEWIVDTMRNHGAVVSDQIFNTTICALRHAPLREYYDGIVLDRNGTRATIDVFQKHLTDVTELPSFVAKLDHANCYGVIVDEETILTIADCADKRISRIVLPELVNISTIHVHPRYTKGSNDNNIAVVKLDRLLDFSSEASAACIWHGIEPLNNTFKTIGFGRNDLNTENLYNGLDPTTTYLTSKITAQNESTCRISADYLSILKRSQTSENFCVGNDFFLVPGTCNLAIGGPLYRPIYEKNFAYSYAYGLAQFGKDCGYGEHLIATRLSSHVDWLKSMLLPNQQKDVGDSLFFLDSDRHDGDRCYIEVGQEGRCVALEKCTDSLRDLVGQHKVKFCSTTSVICCPLDVIESNELRNRKSDLDDCPAVIKRLEPSDNDGALARFGWDAGDWYDFGCFGSIITARIIVTTVSCLGPNKPDVVQLLGDIEDDLFLVDDVLVHELYNETVGSNDIALVKINETLTWSSSVYPVCLWMNKTHTPLVMRMIFVDGDHLDQASIIAKYNSDCQRTHPTPLHHSQLCGKQPRGDSVCRNASDVLISQTIEGGVPYLVGMAQHDVRCSTWNYGMFTRISPLVGWIKRSVSNLDRRNF